MRSSIDVFTITNNLSYCTVIFKQVYLVYNEIDTGDQLKTSVHEVVFKTLLLIQNLGVEHNMDQEDVMESHFNLKILTIRIHI